MSPPGVYPPQGDTLLLTEAFRAADPPRDAKVLDVGTGTGAIAVAAALNGSEQARVTAIDISRRAVLAARINAWLSGARIRILRGDLFSPVAGERFDVILANPPYVPGPEIPAVRNASIAWDAGLRGRLILDRICGRAPRMLTRGGTLLLVHSVLSGEYATLRRLRDAGLQAMVVARRVEPFGPVMHARASWLEARGLISRGQREEELVVIRADRVH